jgi:hypothetical protein
MAGELAIVSSFSLGILRYPQKNAKPVEIVDKSETFGHTDCLNSQVVKVALTNILWSTTPLLEVKKLCRAGCKAGF